MMQAMNTGHSGSMSTIHANTARDALGRIENMILMGTGNLPMRAIRSRSRAHSTSSCKPSACATAFDGLPR